MTELPLSLDFQHLLWITPTILLIEGFFSGSEIALLSSDRLVLEKLKKQGSAGARVALELLRSPEKIFSVTLLMTALMIVANSSLITLYLNQMNMPYAGVFSILISSPLIVIFGEILPKTIYQRFSLKLTPWIAQIIVIFYYLFYPATKTLSLLTTKLSKILGPLGDLFTGKRMTSREELLKILSSGKRDSELKPSERKMIKRIFSFKDSDARKALIPLVRVDAIAQGSTIREALSLFNNHRHSRMPVYKKRIDNIIGVIEVTDLLVVQELHRTIDEYVHPALYVAETQTLRDVLLDLHQKQDEMAVVVDEHGGAVGILTTEDIIEEIVGEIDDEYDSTQPRFREMSPDSWVVQAHSEIAQINETLKLDLPKGEYETLAGFLLQQFGRIPSIRDELFFDTSAGTLRFTIRYATERSIESVIIQKMEKPQS